MCIRDSSYYNQQINHDANDLVIFVINASVQSVSNIVTLLVVFEMCIRDSDTCGRHAGDLALGAVATAMRSGLRSTDELVRYGCDKFVVVMPNIPSDDFARRLHQVSDAVHATIVPGHEYVSLTACVGGVLIHGETVDEGVGRAVQLLGRAKAKAGTVVT